MKGTRRNRVAYIAEINGDTSFTDVKIEIYDYPKQEILNENIWELDKMGRLICRATSSRDMIYVSDQFEDGRLKKGARGFSIGEKGFVRANIDRKSSIFIKFGADHKKAMDYFNYIGDETALGNVDVEFFIQRADVPKVGDYGKLLMDDTTPMSVVGTSGKEDNVQLPYSGDIVKLLGHTHPRKVDKSLILEEMETGPLNPSGFRMKTSPTKANNYKYEILRMDDDAVSMDSGIAGRLPNAICFIYAPIYNTTIIYTKTEIVKAYEGKYNPSK